MVSKSLCIAYMCKGPRSLVDWLVFCLKLDSLHIERATCIYSQSDILLFCSEEHCHGHEKPWKGLGMKVRKWPDKLE